ncbi:cupredoxin domain-containing protein [Candidatus Nitrosacidococcus tergens]|uniref:Cytochrome c oxidase, subunit II n=1 Tax=Candidatus Nitrosacidococcus tergens TaxID=553981 RepID=A0A7G1Q7A1_9GAMM|nr:cytochrome C oxidase subunit II [Candidatus Nitrosacidococcus tergens]CAB1274373.1 Cytochrome c oxidase, subunit II [Candidatus Nitrosacidococcus tergens]
MQSIAWSITLFGMVALIVVFYTVINSAKTQEDYSSFSGAWYSFRTKWFYILITLGVILTYLTLKPFPIPSQTKDYSDGAEQVVDVVGHQWYWDMSTDKIITGKPVVFKVASEDVNHGFGIYDDNLNLLGQTQAMPEYTNKLVYTFDKPGKYHILCLEYCGLAHHGMVSDFTVEAN